jgi:hypothetical protein
MKKIAALFATGLLASTMLVGCGANPASTDRPTRSQVPAQRLQPAQGWNNGQPGMAGAPNQMGQAGGDQATQQLMSMVRQAYATNTGFKATVQTYEHGKGKTETDTLKIAYRKSPLRMRLDILKATNTQAVGVKLHWEGGEDFKIKPTWMPFAVGVGIDDNRVISLNGWTIKQTDVSCIYNVLLDPSTQVKVVGQNQNFDGLMLTALEVHSPKSPSGVDHEIVGIDPSNGLPKARLMFRGQELLYKLVVKSVQLGAPSESETNI